MKKVINLNEHIKLRNIEKVLQQDFYELYKVNGKEFIINVFSYIVKQLEGMEE